MRTIVAKRWKGTWKYIGDKDRFRGKTGTEEVTAESKEAAEATIRGIASKELFSHTEEQGFFEVVAEEIPTPGKPTVH
jgi:hypothetical protein